MSIFAVLKPNLVMTDVEEIFITVAQNRGHEAYVFVAKNVDFERRKIFGRTIENGRIVEKEFDFPDVVQNRLAVKAEDKETYIKLAEMIPFSTNRVGTKKQVEQRLKRVPELEKFLIEVEDCKDLETIEKYLDKYPKIILKPLASNQGKGIYSIEQNSGKYILKKFDEEQNIDQQQLKEFFNEHIKNRNYSISPFFRSEAVNKQTTVFRMHLTRGAGGRWQMIKFFPYVNINPNVDITNGMQGALITTREKLFLEQNYPTCHNDIQQSIRELFKIFPTAFQKLYAWRLDALGLDLGIDQEGNIGIFEVNAGPGIGFMAYPVAKAQVEYYEWLKDAAKPPFNNYFLPIHLRDRKAS